MCYNALYDSNDVLEKNIYIRLCRHIKLMHAVYFTGINALTC